MLKSDLTILKNIETYFNPILKLLSISIFISLLIPISNEYKHKNHCIKTASKQLQIKLPSSYIKESGIEKIELSKMLAYQLCTHRNDN